jgi:hypothetical protein
MTFPVANPQIDYTPAAGHPAALTYTVDDSVDPADGVFAGQLVGMLPSGGVAPTAGAPAGTNNYVGVAAHPAGPGQPLTVLCGAGVQHESETTAAVAAGAFVTSAADGAIAAGTAANGIGVAVRGGNSTATPPTLCRWQAGR